MTRINTGSIRVSSDEQKKLAQSVALYKDDLLRHGVSEENIFVELARSGSMSESDDLDIKVKNRKLFATYDLQKKRPLLYDWLTTKVMNNMVDTHYIYRWDRLARESALIKFLTVFCQQYGTKIVATHDTNHEVAKFMIIAMAEFESKLTKTRVGSGKEFRFEQGLYLGTKKLHGYKKAKIEIGNRKFLHLVPEPNEHQMILDIFSKLDYKIVCNKYNINPHTYYSIRKNRFYCGYISYKGKERKGVHKPLVSEKLWQKYNHSQ